MIMKRATFIFSAPPKARTGKYRRIILFAMLLAVGVTAFGLGGAKQARAEPPDPCRQGRCGF
jgi:hypothetical protein